MKKTLKGFTLIELGIVVFAISVLTGIIVPYLQNYIVQAEKATDYANAALLYDDVSLVIASDDDAYFSFYNDNGGNRTAQLPQRKSYTDPVTKKTVWYWDKNSSNGHKTSIVTRCSGVDAAQEYALAKKMDMLYGRKYSNGTDWSGLHDPFYNGNNKGKYTLYTWEPVCGNNDGDKVKAMQPAELMKRVKNGTDQGEYFTKMLSEKMDMPVWGDAKADKSKSHFRMRYTGGHKYTQEDGKPDLSNDMYAWEWMITIDKDSKTGEGTFEPRIWRGNGQMTLVDSIYPPQTQQKEVLDGPYR